MKRSPHRVKWPETKPDYAKNGPVFVKKDGQTVRTEDPASGQRTWKRKFPRLAKFSSRCRICQKDIAVGEEIAYKPNYPADHWECYVGTQTGEEVHDSGPDGGRHYASRWYSGAGKKSFSARAKRDMKIIARVQERRDSSLNGRAEADEPQT